ncbi:hypothetical protein [Actinoplanes regularis]|uniref:galactose-binding domain-containing protein n=1 Tax=Actinoplanes regularis TaxID=52697 RepID=UPI0024A0E09D|nr:hypothetical protein [Actinoplanes regularis]GLW28520.1 hypothetical protein Areg01_14600 [Actinoplanes regularis]
MIWIVAALLLGRAVVPGGPVVAHDGLIVDPDALRITTGQCNGDELTVRLTNTGRKAIYADASLSAPAELHLPRTLISTWLPPRYTSSVPVPVRATDGARPGTYHVRVSSRGRTADVPVTVTDPPASADLVRSAARVTVSSARADAAACNAIDGNPVSMWIDATGKRWPDWWRVDWAAARRVSRVAVTTTAQWGLRDWDVQVAEGQQWVTVASVRDNTAVEHVSQFAERRTGSVRIVTRAGNQVNDVSRLVEVVIR